MSHRCAIDPTIRRVTMGGVAFPLGVFPIQPAQPKVGYSVDFESADGGSEGEEFEEWPDRYVFDVVIGADRLPALCRALYGLLPSRVYPILDIMGHDAYREIDPYIAYELVGLDRFLDGVRWFEPFFYEDGLCGFGAMCDDPFIYMTVDEHKVITLRCIPDDRERIERVLRAFDLAETPEPRAADSANHEHRSVLLTPDEHPEWLSFDEIIERLLDQWRLILNIDDESNLDDDGRQLGVTGWRCLVRFQIDGERSARYAEVVLWCGSYRAAEEAAHEAASRTLEFGEDAMVDVLTVSADRVRPDDLPGVVDRPGGTMALREAVEPAEDGRVIAIRWLGTGPDPSGANPDSAADSGSNGGSGQA